MPIPIGVVGYIRNKDGPDAYVMVEDDRSNTGGYLILYSSEPEFRIESGSPNCTGHDDWVMTDDLDGYFEEASWDIEWL